jgi:hypothetical protein
MIVARVAAGLARRGGAAAKIVADSWAGYGQPGDTRREQE